MYEIVQHTADVRMRVSGSTREELFTDAVRGLMSVSGGPASAGRSTTSVHVHIEAPDLTSLLVDFLNELLTRCHIDRVSVRTIAIESLSDTAIDARIELEPAGEFDEDVKAVTYHEAEVRQRDGRWSTTLVFDI